MYRRSPTVMISSAYVARSIGTGLARSDLEEFSHLGDEAKTSSTNHASTVSTGDVIRSDKQEAQKFVSPMASTVSGFTARNALNASFPFFQDHDRSAWRKGLKIDLPGTYPLRRKSGHCARRSFSLMEKHAK